MNKNRCPQCGSTQAHRVWLWLKNRLWMNEIEITKNAKTGEFTLRKVRRRVFSMYKDYAWREYSDISSIRIPMRQMEKLRQDLDWWMKPQEPQG